MARRRSRVLHTLLLRIIFGALWEGFGVEQAISQTAGAAAAPREEIFWQADSQSTDGRTWRYLRGNVELRKQEMLLRADEVDYNEQTGDAEARGNVRFLHPGRQEDVYAERFTYNLKTETGMFYKAHGTAGAGGQVGPGMLTTDQPFYFQAETAQKTKDRYLIHDGFVTNCKMPNP